MEILAPWTIRERTSRPSWSVPRGCSAEGGSRIFRTSMRLGSWRVKAGGYAATTNRKETTTAPATARRFFMSRRRKSRNMEVDAAAIISLRPDPRVCIRIPDVGQ
jgi:hypothetical protein